MNPVDFVALFGAGIAAFVTPCVLPLVPAYVGMIAGEVANDDTPSLSRGTLLFVAGSTIVFVTLGVVAGQIGSSLSIAIDSLQRAGGVLVVGFGLLLLATHRGRVVRSARLLDRLPLPSGRISRPFVMGVAFGAAWTPCVGPLLGSALLVASTSRNPIEGALLLGAFSLGLGTPFVAFALASASSRRVPAVMRRVSRHVVPAAALVLVVMGGLLATGIYGRLVNELI